LHHPEHGIADDFRMARLRGTPADQRERAIREVPHGELAQRAPHGTVVPVLLAQPRAVFVHDVVPRAIVSNDIRIAEHGRPADIHTGHAPIAPVDDRDASARLS
jgi:hypothetical protein